MCYPQWRRRREGEREGEGQGSTVGLGLCSKQEFHEVFRSTWYSSPVVFPRFVVYFFRCRLCAAWQARRTPHPSSL